MDEVGPLRDKIREIDEGILTLLEARFELVGKLWEIKKANRIAFRDKRKERQILDELKSKSTINPILVESLYTMIFEENERQHG